MSLSPVEDEPQRKKHKAYIDSTVVVVPDDSQMPEESLVVESWRPSVKMPESFSQMPEGFSQEQMPESFSQDQMPTTRRSPHELAADVESQNLRLEEEMWRAESEKPETPKMTPPLSPFDRPLLKFGIVSIDLESDSDTDKKADTDKRAGASSSDISRHPVVQKDQKGLISCLKCGTRMWLVGKPEP